MARPKLDIDPEQVEKLSAINCSYAEMASVLGCDPSTLTRRFAQAIEKGRAQGKMSLKRKQFEMAMAGNVTMLIWLGKIILEQRDTSNINFQQAVVGMTEEYKGKTKSEMLKEAEKIVADEKAKEGLKIA